MCIRDRPEEHHPHGRNLAEQALGDHRAKLDREDADQHEPHGREARRRHAVQPSMQGGELRDSPPPPTSYCPTTEQRYISSVFTIVISGLTPAAAASTSSSDWNWCGVNPWLKTMRFCRHSGLN